MARIVHYDIICGRILNIGDTIMLYHQEHVVKKSEKHGYYLEICDTRKENDWIFSYLGIENKYDFCGEPDSNSGIFPYKDTLEELTYVVKKLWEYIPLKVGDKVLVRDIENNKEIDDYAVAVVDRMKEYSNSYITVEYMYFQRGEYHDKYGIYWSIRAKDYCWSADTLDFTKIIKADACIKLEDITALKHQPIPSNNILQTKIKIPKKNKNLKVNL